MQVGGRVLRTSGILSGVIRGIGIAVGAALLVVGLVVGVRAFHITFHTPDVPPVSLPARCRAPAIGAWNTAPKGKLAVWATTSTGFGTLQGTWRIGYEVKSGQAPYCANRARLRLAGALVA